MVNFEEFQGEVSKSGIYTFPSLHHLDSNNKHRIWSLYIRIIKKDGQSHEINWDIKKEKQLKISLDYFKTGTEYINLPSDAIVEAWVETGIIDGKITRSSPTYFEDNAFEGQKNQRNAFQQAMIYGRSQYLKRVNKGGETESEFSKSTESEFSKSTESESTKEEKKKTKSKKESKDHDTNSITNTNSITDMYFPMLAKAYKDGKKHLKYPLYIQPKLDGMRCLAFLKSDYKNYSDVVIYSRTKKEFGNIEYIKKVLFPFLAKFYDKNKNQSIYLDGELYLHGKKLQDISGQNRKEFEDTDDKNKNQYHIYDCFYPNDLNQKFKDRKELLASIFSTIKKDNNNLALEYIKPVETLLVQDEKESEKIFNRFISEKYEGAILRNIDGPYLANKDKTGAFMRSKDLVKMKKKFTDEFEIVGFTEGRGKDKSAIIWICKTKKGVEFNVAPKDMTYEERYKLYSECKKDFSSYIGKPLTVEYEDLSKLKVPQRAKALVIRDYE
jgi:DNA ligase-1